MSEEIRQLEPKVLWTKFADLNAVPRPSKKEERVIQFMLDFGHSLGLETSIDAVGNVIIRKAASPGMEDRKMITLQSHLDMVHQKNADTLFDFDKEGIKMLVAGDWVKAEGTTLGADNGIGVATIMALLESTTIPHPPLEALFTIDEETGMTGAMGLQSGILQGQILLNLDTEEDDEIDIGCAGGIDVTAIRTYVEENTSEGWLGYRIAITGLQGGHSGMDIHKGLGNANKLMNALLTKAVTYSNARIATIDGGSLRNAIPRESFATLLVPEAKKDQFTIAFEPWVKAIKEEFISVEPGLNISCEAMQSPPSSVMELEAQQQLLEALEKGHNGVYAMSATMEDLVQTSNNIARVQVQEGTIKIGCLTRSSLNSEKMELAELLKGVFEEMGCTVSFDGDYPGWNPNPDSAILKVLVAQYKALFKATPRVVACHAGLECGILGQNYPDMDMISFGPTIEGAHSPDERVSISSVQKYWKFVLEILKHAPTA
ncbi:aminoacyl-histidine dipeptidase [Spongiimicrobium salis]|uniref:aminoacyl-histidine dipeptidase n=1 Tax=Spongiimicrobium salis TaxID=1667022 RepID=UPI00374D867C